MSQFGYFPAYNLFSSSQGELWNESHIIFHGITQRRVSHGNLRKKTNTNIIYKIYRYLLNSK